MPEPGYFKKRVFNVKHLFYTFWMFNGKHRSW